MRSAALAVLLLALPQAAVAGGKVEKAEKQIALFEAGNREALVKAVAFADAAAEGDDPAAWAVRGRTYLLLATNPEVPRPDGDPAVVAAESYEKALAGGDTVRDAIAGQVPVLESTVVAALVNDVEGKQWADAAGRLALALRVHALAEQVAGRDADREAAIRRLAVQVTAQNGDLAGAKDHYAAFVSAAGRHDSGLAALVAKKLAAGGDLDGALAFLAPLDVATPDDERLLRTEVELLLGADRRDDAAKRLGLAEEKLVSSVSGAFLAATLYAQIGAEQRSRVMWERLVALDPQHLEGRIALGRSYTDLAKRLRAELSSPAGEELARKGSVELQRITESLGKAWKFAEQHLLAARKIEVQSAPALEGLIALYESQIEGVDPATLKKAEREPFAAHQKRIEDLKAELTAMGSR